MTLNCVIFRAKLLKDTEYNVSRGIDFKLVSNVLNFDFPLSAIRYVHRVGRTARADQMGTAISFVNSSEEVRLPDVAKLLSQNNAFVDDKKSVGTLTLVHEMCVN